MQEVLVPYQQIRFKQLVCNEYYLCHIFNNSSEAGNPTYTNSSTNSLLVSVLAAPLQIYFLLRDVEDKIDIDLLREVSKSTPNILPVII